MKKVMIYTDGACSGNPGPGGWGAILLYQDANGKEYKKEISGGEPETTNNRMELTGVIEALKILNQPCEIDLYSDSKYIIDAMEKGWALRWRENNWMRNRKEPALNPDLWEELLNLNQKHDIKYHWVKGHASNEYNNRCDELAVQAREKYK